MTNANLDNFGTRVGRIAKRHRKFASQGMVIKTDRDGLITARARSRAPRFPWRVIAVTLMLFFLFKSVVLIQLGEVAYGERIAKLNAGTTVEKAGAYIMRADPATKWIVVQFGGAVE